MTPGEIKANCGLGADCACTQVKRPWMCRYWGRSSLACPNVVSAYSPNARIMSQNTGHGEKLVKEQNAESLHKRRKHNEKWGEKLRRIRHSDPVKHLAKKGIKVNR